MRVDLFPICVRIDKGSRGCSYIKDDSNWQLSDHVTNAQLKENKWNGDDSQINLWINQSTSIVKFRIIYLVIFYKFWSTSIVCTFIPLTGVRPPRGKKLIWKGGGCNNSLCQNLVFLMFLHNKFSRQNFVSHFLSFNYCYYWLIIGYCGCLFFVFMRSIN